VVWGRLQITHNGLDVMLERLIEEGKLLARDSPADVNSSNSRYGWLRGLHAAGMPAPQMARTSFLWHGNGMAHQGVMNAASFVDDTLCVRWYGNWPG
jgi:hypothetical protein